MDKWKLPPKEKIYEAFSVLADSRYKIESPGKATITSSGGNRQYSVKWVMDKASSKTIIRISSNDNASHWQGYTGYPIIAVLMLNDLLQFDNKIIDHFKSIPWNTLNKSYKNDYSKAVNKILSDINDKNEVNKIRTEVENLYDQISKLELVKFVK